MQDRLNGALYLIHRRVPVFPLHGLRPVSDGRLVCTCGNPACDSAGKHPLADLAPRGLTNATTDEVAVRNWFTVAPFANIGMATGVIVVLDVDPRHGGDDSLRALEAKHGLLPITTRAHTGGGGQHIFFRAPEGEEIRNSAGRLAPGLDVRGVGGYVVAPPSLHASGQHYVWSPDHHPDQVSPTQMPEWLVQALAHPRDRGSPQNSSNLHRLIADGVAEGGRNTAVSRLTGHLLRRWVDPQVVHELVQAWNIVQCRPPLSPDEVTKIVGSIARKEFKRREARGVITS